MFTLNQHLTGACGIDVAHSDEDHEVVDGVRDPGPEDIIACTLVGDDEVTDEAVALADRILADLKEAGFVVVVRP